MRAVIDTNVLLVANQQHKDVSLQCVVRCIELLKARQLSGIVVIDDGYRILAEYQNKTSLHPPKGVGDVFLKWLLREAGNKARVEQVPLTETAENCFAEFPAFELENSFDPPDRKFVAVAHAHPNRPPIMQAVDCKWLDWWPALQEKGIRIEFVCPDDACRFYQKKFPNKPAPTLPE